MGSDYKAGRRTGVSGGTLVEEVEGVNIYFVGKHGDDSNDGKSEEQAFKTFGAATAIASSGDVIVCHDGGSYNERIEVPIGVDINAPNAKLEA